MPVRILITEGTRADCKEAVPRIQGLGADALLADQDYDTREMVDYALASGMAVVIPPKRNRKVQHGWDRHRYKLRHLADAWRA